MARRRRDTGDEEDEELEEYEAQNAMEEEKRGRRKRSIAPEDDEDGEYLGFNPRGQKKRTLVSQYLDIEAQDDSDDEEDEEEEGEDGFIKDGGAELPDEDVEGRSIHRRQPLLASEDDDQEDVEAFERSILARYARASQIEEEEEEEEEEMQVQQQALLPSVKDTNLWLVECQNGHERKAAISLMKLYSEKKSDFQITSAIAVNNGDGYIYVEAHKESHVRKACEHLLGKHVKKIVRIPLAEMTDVLSVKSKATVLSSGTWVRMKNGPYKGDLAEVVDVDNARQKVRVKLVPRIDLHALAYKLEGKEAPKKKTILPRPRLMSIDEARELQIRVERKWDPDTSVYFEKMDGMCFHDGFLIKNASMKSIIVENIKPTIAECKFFQKLGYGDKKKGLFMKARLIQS